MSVAVFPKPFGRYLLDAKLATGGMGEVFLARMAGPAGFEKKVVIKRVLPHLAEAPEFVERFLDEGRLVVRLSHGNIAQVLDMGEVDGQYFMAIEHVDGLDLRELLKRLGPKRLPVPIVLTILAEVAKGLDYAHSRVDDHGRNLGIIHRDVSPSNVVISKAGDVKLLDFGVAVANDRRVQSVSGTLHGKFAYMSPEQASGRPLDRRSDLFSLGVLGYELLTGVRPFDAATDLATLDRIRSGQHVPLTEARPDLDDAARGIVERCLEADPARRFQNGAELVREVLHVLVESRRMVAAADIASAIGPHLPVRQTAPLSVDDALNQELDALLGEASPAGRAARTQAMGPRTPVPITASERRPVVVDTPVPRSSRTRILVVALVLLVGVLVTLNLTMLRELRQRDGGPTPAEPATRPAAVLPAPAVVAPVPETRPREAVAAPDPRTRRAAVAPEPPAPVPPLTLARPDDAESRAGRRLVLEPALPRRRPKPLEPQLPVPEVAKGTLKFRVLPAAARITLVGAAGAESIANPGLAITRELPEGQYRLLVELDGQRTERTVTIVAGRRQTLPEIRVGP